MSEAGKVKTYDVPSGNRFPLPECRGGYYVRTADHRAAVKELSEALEELIFYAVGLVEVKYLQDARAVLAKYKEASDEDNA